MPDQEAPKVPNIPPTIPEVALTLDVVYKMFLHAAKVESDEEHDQYTSAGLDLLYGIKKRCETGGPMQVRMETLQLLAQLNSQRPH